MVKEIPDWDVLKYKHGEIAKRWDEGGIACAIMRGTGSWCAYVGIHRKHLKAGFGYDKMPLRVHWGLTYAGRGIGACEEINYWWYGWDYAHSGDDFSFRYEEPLKSMVYDKEDELFRKTDELMRGQFSLPPDHRWTIPEVELEVKDAALQLAKRDTRSLKGLRRMPAWMSRFGARDIAYARKIAQEERDQRDEMLDKLQRLTIRQMAKAK